VQFQSALLCNFISALTQRRSRNRMVRSVRRYATDNQFASHRDHAMQPIPTLTAKNCSVAATRSRRLTCLGLVLLAPAAFCGRVTNCEAQGITLPTVRAFGPGPEEALMLSLVRELTVKYRVDSATTPPSGDPARVTRAIQALRRLDVIMLASITENQRQALAETDIASNQAAALNILAGDQHVANDPTPRGLLAAYQRIASDSETCAQLGAEARAKANAAAYRVVFSATQRRLIRDTLSRRVSVARTLCALPPDELREREPSRQFSAIKTDEVMADRVDRVASLDSLIRLATAVVIRRKLAGQHFFVLRSREQAAAFWRQQGFAPLNVGSITGSRESGTAFTELASPLVHFLRASLNAVLSAEKPTAPATAPAAATGAMRWLGNRKAAASAAGVADEKSTAAIQRLLTGGGLVNIGFAYPLFYAGDGSGTFHAMLLAAPRFGLTAPILGVTANDTTSVSMDAGIELHLKMFDANNGAGLVSQVRVAQARGSSGYITSLGVPDRDHFTYLTGSVGFAFSKQYMLTASRVIGGPSLLRKTPWQIGLTILRTPVFQ
jgi:hypothetical protein